MEEFKFSDSSGTEFELHLHKENSGFLWVTDRERDGKVMGVGFFPKNLKDLRDFLNANVKD